jgi:hypothetical protein
MQIIKIPLKGITHATSDNMSEDGEMTELLNLRHKDGSLQPTFEAKKVLPLTSDYDKVFVHSNGSYENWLGYKSSTGDISWIATNNGELTASGPTAIMNTSNLNTIEQVGHIVIVTDETGVRHLYFKDGVYNVIDLTTAFRSIHFIAGMRTENNNPTINIPLIQGDGIDWTALHGKLDYLVADAMAPGTTVTSDVEEDVHTKKNVDNALLSAINTTKAKADEYGWLYGTRFVRYAVRLYDGSYILHSDPIIITPPRGAEKEEVISEYLFVGLKRFYYLSVYKLYAQINAADLSNLKGIVAGIDIFMTKEIDNKDYNDKFVYLYKTTAGSTYLYETVSMGANVGINSEGQPVSEATYEQYYKFKHKESFIDDVKDESLFYKVHELSLDDLSITQMLTIDTKNTRESLVTNERLTDDDYTHNAIIPQTSFVYNSKLHLGDIKTRLWGGFTAGHFLSFFQQNSALPIEIRIEVVIDTDEGEKKVLSEPFTSKEGIYKLRPYLSYPDYRARRMTIWCSYRGAWHKVKELPLTAHKLLNLAYYLNTGFATIDLTAEPTTPPLAEYQELPSVNNFERSSKKMKVSLVSNPFVFPAKNTYDMGGDIIAMASVNQSVSEGTAFGSNPLYVFTDRGIKLLQVGTGDVYYSNISDGPREVCVNKGGVLPIESGIVFPTSRGIAIISGTQVQHVSDMMRGVWADNIIAEPEIVQAATDSRWAVIQDYLTVFPFETFYKTFLESTTIGYNRNEDELLIAGRSPSGLDMCFVVNTKSWLWHKASYQAKQFITMPHTLYYLGTDGVYDMNKTGNPLGAMMITRPIKIGSTAFKALRRIIMRGAFYAGQVTESGVLVYSYEDYYNGNAYTRLLVYGSQDCYRWKYLGGVDRGGSFNDLALNTFHTSCKYFRIVYVGTPFYNTRLDALELHIGERYEHKPR